MRSRLLVVIALALAACAVNVSVVSATGDGGVVVENPGTYEVESEVDIGIFVSTGMGYSPLLQCDNHWDLSVDEFGVGEVSAEGIFPHAQPLRTGAACTTMEPCTSHAAWPLSLEESEAGDFIVHVTFCLENTGTFVSGLSFDAECDYDAVNNTVHCDEVLAPGILELEGELQVHGDPGVMHEIE